MSKFLDEDYYDGYEAGYEVGRYEGYKIGYSAGYKKAMERHTHGKILSIKEDIVAEEETDGKQVH